MAGNSGEQSGRTSHTSKGNHENSERVEGTRHLFLFVICPKDRVLEQMSVLAPCLWRKEYRNRGKDGMTSASEAGVL